MIAAILFALKIGFVVAFIHGIKLVVSAWTGIDPS